MKKTSKTNLYHTEADKLNTDTMLVREADWRIGPIVYQVFVDRFAPSDQLSAKVPYYQAPRKLHAWSDVPLRGHLNEDVKVWTHELDFWGGDLQSLQSKLRHVVDLGADVLYLQPIQDAFTNHKYDAQDWAKVAPEYGTRQDVIDLAKELHANGMRLMLDGVFNHMGRRSPLFQAAASDLDSPYRSWFFFGEQYPSGCRTWAGADNLVEVQIEDPSLQSYLWGDSDSVVQQYLKDGVDGWRLDTAYELGPKYLAELTRAAHEAKPDSVVIGEAWNYPQGWLPAMDGIMNFYARRVVLEVVIGRISPISANRLLERMVQDAPIESLLKSWMVLDNHDTDRLKSLLPDARDQKLAQVLQFTLPGSPVVYYGSEIGMDGQGDPGSRAPMRWDLVTAKNPELAWMKKLIKLRKGNRALRIGDYVALDCERLVGFARHTDQALDTVVVLVNPTSEVVTEVVSFRDGRLMNGAKVKDLLSGVEIICDTGFAVIEMPPKSARVFKYQDTKGYSPYKRVP